MGKVRVEAELAGPSKKKRKSKPAGLKQNGHKSKGSQRNLSQPFNGYPPYHNLIGDVSSELVCISPGESNNLKLGFGDDIAPIYYQYLSPSGKLIPESAETVIEEWPELDLEDEKIEEVDIESDSNEKPRKPHHSGPIQETYQHNRRLRQKTFSRRKNTVLNQAKRLAVITNAEVSVYIKSDTGRYFKYESHLKEKRHVQIQCTDISTLIYKQQQRKEKRHVKIQFGESFVNKETQLSEEPVQERFLEITD
ncbi:uncharacterized protein LOC144411649 isoform X2 [Styela clava]